jgi:hypothetical protein
VTVTVTKKRVLNLKKVNMWECLHVILLPFPSLLDERCNFRKLLRSIINLYKMKKWVLW